MTGIKMAGNVKADENMFEMSHNTARIPYILEQ